MSTEVIKETELPARAPTSVGAQPNVKALIAEFRRAAPWGGNNLKLNEDVRFCRWAGKQADGKKRGTSAKGAFPWEGSSDLDPHVADELVEWVTCVSYLAFWKAWLGLKAGGTEESNYAVKLADWIINQLLDEELGLVEVELSEQFRQTYGWVVLYVTWVVEVSLRYERVTLEEVLGRITNYEGGIMKEGESGAGGPAPSLTASAVVTMIEEPIYEGQVVELLKPVLEAIRREGIAELSEAHEVTIEDLRDGALRKAVKNLREKRSCEIPTPYVCHNGPVISALKPWRDVVLKSTQGDAQKAGIVWHREYISEQEADGRIATRKWNKEFVDELKKQKGKVTSWIAGDGYTVNDTKPTTVTGAMAGEGEQWNNSEGHPDLMEVVTAVYRQNDENGVPGIYATVFHPGIGGGGSTESRPTVKDFAEHGLVDGSEGHMPYVVGRREVPDRAVVSSRGLPEVTAAWQRTEKSQLDAMIDLLGIGVHPPLNIYENVFGAKYVYGPGQVNLVKRGFEPAFPEVPLKGFAPSEEMMRICERRAGRRVGRKHPEDIEPGDAMVIIAKQTQTFLMMWSAAIKQAVCLCQAHMPDSEFSRITGAPAGWLEGRRYNRNLMGAKLEFDVRELDPEYAREVLKTINEGILPDDVMGVTNRAKLTKWKWRLLNPRLARELVDEEGAASQKMMDEVMLQVALMWQGNEPKYTERDASAMHKLQFLQQIVMANPLYANAMTQDANANPRFVELVKKYMDHLMFQKEEMVDNAQIGRIGVRPGEEGK